MNLFKQAPKEQSDVQRWAGKIAELRAQQQQVEADQDTAARAVADALLAGSDSEAASLRAAQLEHKARGLVLAIEAAQGHLAAAKAAEADRVLEQKKVAEAKIGDELRQQWIEYGRTLAAELAALQQIATTRKAYYANLQGASGINDRAYPLGDPAAALEHIYTYAKALEVRLGAVDYGKTGLPPYHAITLTR